MKQFADPNLFEALSTGDKMAGSLITTLMGMGVTFAILVLLWVFIALMSRALGATGKEHRKEEAPGTVAEEAVAGAEVEGDEADEEELIAVITAAIAGNQRKKSHVGLVLKKIERIHR